MLVEHIRHVVATSLRLTPCALVACISYTNVAADEIRRRLGPSGERVEVSTIHSFLYRNVVKPYLHLLKDENGCPQVNYAKVIGHDEHRPRYDLIKAWLRSVNPKLEHILLNNKQSEVQSALKRLAWKLDPSTDQWVVECRQKARVQGLPYAKLSSYKPYYWNEGIIDHEDVLYFGYLILKENALLRSFLSSRFPYIFIDKFQDTHPVQSAIIKWLAENKTYVGVIGDPQQAIFSFQGTQSDACEQFKLPNLKSYVISGNRRSTKSIIRFLNQIREDKMVQTGNRDEEGESVQFYEGDIKTVVAHVKSNLPLGSSLAILARSNDHVGMLRSLPNGDANQLWLEFLAADYKRAEFFEALVGATELVRRQQYTEAFRRITKAFRIQGNLLKEPLKNDFPVTDLDVRGCSVALQEFTTTHYARLAQESLFSVYNEVSDLLTTLRGDLRLTSLSKGKAKEFCIGTQYGSLCTSVRLTEDKREIRTIHKAKGAEFDQVLVACEKPTAINQLLGLLPPKDDEGRINYVGISRAKNKLMLTGPALTAPQMQRLGELGVTIVKL